MCFVVSSTCPAKPHHLHPFTRSFVPYVLFEIPGNLFLKRFRPHIWRKSNSQPMFLNLWDADTPGFPVPGCVFLFGCFTIAQGFVKNWSGLLATRFFLGLVEAGVSPGCYYIIAMYAVPLRRQRHNSSELFDQVVQA